MSVTRQQRSLMVTSYLNMRGTPCLYSTQLASSDGMKSSACVWLSSTVFKQSTNQIALRGRDFEGQSSSALSVFLALHHLLHHLHRSNLSSGCSGRDPWTQTALTQCDLAQTALSTVTSAIVLPPPICTDVQSKSSMQSIRPLALRLPLVCLFCFHAC